MTTKIKYFVSALLILSSGLLIVLIPGGPIETRDFSHINPFILGAFNTFLTSLGIGSLLIIYFLFKNMNWAFITSAICGISYFLVYVLDLGKIFPVSPDAMPEVLFIIEVLGTIVSLPLIFISVRGAMKAYDSGDKKVMSGEMYSKEIYSKKFIYVVIFIAFVSVSIITFATKSAMG